MSLNQYLINSIRGVIFDDYNGWIGAFAAILDFRIKFNIKTPIIQIYHGQNEIIRGVYFGKPDESEVKYCQGMRAKHNLLY